MNRRDELLKKIRKNINNHGYHVYHISGSHEENSYIYTIGLRERFGFELIVLGWISFEAKKLISIIKSVVDMLSYRSFDVAKSYFEEEITVSNFSDKKMDTIGLTLNLRKIDSSWINILMQGAIDFYSNENITALQIIPQDSNLSVLTIPNMSKKYEDEYIYSLSEDYIDPKLNVDFYVDLDILKGRPILEVFHIENDDWQALSFHSSEKDLTDKVYRISLYTVLKIDSNIVHVLDLKVGEWARRETFDECW